jgi:hypothetical protein
MITRGPNDSRFLVSVNELELLTIATALIAFIELATTHNRHINSNLREWVTQFANEVSRVLDSV